MGSELSSVDSGLVCEPATVRGKPSLLVQALRSVSARNEVVLPVPPAENLQEMEIDFIASGAASRSAREAVGGAVKQRFACFRFRLLTAWSGQGAWTASLISISSPPEEVTSAAAGWPERIVIKRAGASQRKVSSPRRRRFEGLGLGRHMRPILSE